MLWRHARTAWNAGGRFQGQTDAPLDDVGRQQAAEAARRLASLRPDLLVSSDLSRAHDTIAQLGAIVGHEVVLDPRVRETHGGQWEGLTGEEITAGWPDEWAAWLGGDTTIRTGNSGETRREVAARTAEALRDIATKLPDDGLAVIATHGGSARLGIATLIGMPLERFTNIGGLSNASWSMLRESSHGWILVEHNAGTLPTPVPIVEG